MVNDNADKQIMRAKWHDYRTEGCYMLTMNVENRTAMPFGTVNGESELMAAVVLTPLGASLDKAIADIPVYYPETEVLDHIVMPDHCHILLHVRKNMEKHLGNVVRALKSVTTKAYLNALSEKYGGIYRTTSNPRGYREKPAGNTGRNRTATIVIDGISVDAHIVAPLWAAGYHDRIVRRRGQLAKLRQYIRRNPARLWLKQHADRGLTAVRDIRIPLTIDHARQLKQQAEYWDLHRTKTPTATSHRHDGRQYAASYIQLTQRFLRKSITNGTVRPFVSSRACGNRDLLDCGRPLVSVRISRSVTRDGLLSELHRLLDLCETEGAILISPFISWSEKEVLKAARANNYPHIIISGEAMSMFHKPSDATRAVESQYTPQWYSANPIVNVPAPCNDLDCTLSGRLLTIALWPDRPQSERPSKPDCEIMNAVCKLLSSTE